MTEKLEQMEQMEKKVDKIEIAVGLIAVQSERINNLSVQVQAAEYSGKLINALR